MLINYSEDRPNVDLVNIRLLQVLNTMAISNEVLKDTKYTVEIAEEITKVFAKSKIPYFLGESIAVPLTWWDHFKQTYFPSYLLKRFPIKYKKHEAICLIPTLPLKYFTKDHIVIPLFRDYL